MDRLANRAWYSSSIVDFCDAQPESVLGRLSGRSEFPVIPTQRDAWLSQVNILRRSLHGLLGDVFFEFSVPRMGKRIDVVVISGSVIAVIEFKVGESDFDRGAVEQVWDYALDLKNFHEASHAAALVPILVATRAETRLPEVLVADPDGVYRPVLSGIEQLRGVLDLAIRSVAADLIDACRWAKSSYRPTPTIIEAARALYSQHTVDAIARHDAGAKNLTLTSARLDSLVDEARANRRKIICFVTGVPGAGKTLVGLNLATRHRREPEQPTHAVFLSGNAPLVAVMREALTRDEVSRRKRLGEKVRKGKVEEGVKAFIQNVHHFRDEGLYDLQPPVEHVVIFDEAQRAWNRYQTASFMRRKKGLSGFDQSEPEFLVSVMDRHSDWAVVVCLVGGGQEINTGEAGISAWLEAVVSRFPHWQLYISSRLDDSEYAASASLQQTSGLSVIHREDELHLAVSMRSFRAENVSAFVKALLDCNRDAAKAALSSISCRYPIAISRDLRRAKDWVRGRARGSERFGLVASAKAQRLKPHAVDVRVNVNPVHWFLNDRYDTRSSYYLEDAATEFQVQGLELDWTCVSWDGDFRFTGSTWSHHNFRGNQWTKIRKPEDQNYLRNAYRVLLTRARQGMVIFVPPGDADDPTRSPEYYDGTFEYLRGIGLPCIP